MSWWFPKWIFGVDPAEEQKRGEALDAELHKMNAERYKAGLWSYEQFQEAERNAAAGATGDVQAEILAAGVEGASEGLRNELDFASKAADAASSTVKGTLNFAGGMIFNAIPWWLWLVGLGYGFFWLGGLTWLKRRAFK